MKRFGRAEALDVSLREARQRIDSFSENQEFFPALFRGHHSIEKTTALRDVQPKTMTEKVFAYFSPRDRFELNAVSEALDEHNANLLMERDSLERFTLAAREIAKNYEQNLRALEQQRGGTVEKQTSQAVFTPREIVQLENFVQQSDPIVRSQFEAMLRSALTTGQVGNFVDFENSSAAGRQQGQVLDLEQALTVKDDHLDAARNTLNKVGATLNEAAVSAETDTTSEILALL